MNELKKTFKILLVIIAIILLGSCESEEARYTIIFEDGFDNLYHVVTNTANKEIEKPNDPVKENYIFLGWDQEVPNVMPKEDLVIKATWKEITYQITFYDGFGEVYYTLTSQKGKEIKLPENPKKYTYNFLGWDQILPDLMPEKDLVVTALWEEINMSLNPEVNALYDVLQLYYYKELDLNLRLINEISELYEYLDPYTFLYRQETRNIDQDENYVGLGITVNHLEEGLFVTDINLFSGIDEFLYVGDIIVSVDGTSLEGVLNDDRIPLILGEVGTIRTLGVLRLGEYLEFTYDLRNINNQSVRYQVYDDVGYIYIDRFGGDTDELFEAALETLEALEIKELIIDVRNNGGGFLTSVVNILRQFIVDSEPFLIMKNVKGKDETPYYPTLDEKKPYGITVLVNENSASASEVLAEALKQEGYNVFGTTTYGKDVYQGGLQMGSAFPDLFDKDIILNITLGYWLPHNRQRVNEGVVPTETYEQTGLYNYSYPALLEEYQLGDENSIIETFQYLVSKSTNYLNVNKEFTVEFEDALKIYQAANNLLVDGKLNLETQMHLIDYYRTLIKDSSNDEQLIYLVNSLNK